MHMLPANMVVGTHTNPYGKPAYNRIHKWIDLCVAHQRKVLAQDQDIKYFTVYIGGDLSNSPLI